MKICVYGGLFGSEGKGCVAEWFARQISGSNHRSGGKLIVFGENSPNSGHTCSAGKTRNLPASSFFADCVVLGPDSVINEQVLIEDLAAINKWRHEKALPPVELYIHEHAAVIQRGDVAFERDVVERVSSTGSGSGCARHFKFFHRLEDRVIKANPRQLLDCGARMLNRWQWMTFCESVKQHDWIFECSQGALLDTNWGYYPHVTSRTTMPRSVIDRNGLSMYPWEFAGVYRTFPIRTGGPSGPTGGRELQWSELGVEQEIASVTRRVRRVFEPHPDDLTLSLRMTMPQYAFFTHCDYLEPVQAMPSDNTAIEAFLQYVDEWSLCLNPYPAKELYISYKPGEFLYVPLAALTPAY